MPSLNGVEVNFDTLFRTGGGNKSKNALRFMLQMLDAVFKQASSINFVLSEYEYEFNCPRIN